MIVGYSADHSFFGRFVAVSQRNHFHIKGMGTETACMPGKTSSEFVTTQSLLFSSISP